MDTPEQMVADIAAKRGGVAVKERPAVPPEHKSKVPGRPFKPGVCPNPKGRPSLTEELNALLAETDPVTGKRKTRLLAEALYTLALKGSVQAHMLIMDRVDGKQPVEVHVKDVTAKVDTYAADALQVVTEAERITADAATD